MKPQKRHQNMLLPNNNSDAIVWTFVFVSKLIKELKTVKSLFPPQKTSTPVSPQKTFSSCCCSTSIPTLVSAEYK